MECPGCGMQRSLLFLLGGDLRASLSFHPAAIPFLALMGFLPLHLIFKFRQGWKVLIILQVLVATISLGFYVYRIIHHKILV